LHSWFQDKQTLKGIIFLLQILSASDVPCAYGMAWASYPRSLLSCSFDRDLVDNCDFLHLFMIRSRFGVMQVSFVPCI
jgi:hypothetical protein